MSKIMELARNWGEAIAYQTLDGQAAERATLQAEVTRMEQELANAAEARNTWKALADKLAKELAALEVQEPVGRLEPGAVMHGVHYQNLWSRLPVGTPLYLAAGAKEKP